MTIRFSHERIELPNNPAYGVSLETRRGTGRITLSFCFGLVIHDLIVSFRRDGE